MAYVIGQGVRDAMAASGDTPRSDEMYDVYPAAVGHKISVTFGRDAMYYYIQEDNRVHRVVFAPAPAPSPYTPTTYPAFKSPYAKPLNRQPKGFILHGSRSGATTNTTQQEFQGTANYAVTNPGGLGWNATIGDDAIAVHMGYDEWGWNARAASELYLAVEFAQPTVDRPISDAQVRAFVWFVAQALAQYPMMPLKFPTHAELDGTPEYGGYHDGKTDVFPLDDPRADNLRARIRARIAEVGL